MEGYLQLDKGINSKLGHKVLDIYQLGDVAMYQKIFDLELSNPMDAGGHNIENVGLLKVGGKLSNAAGQGGGG